MGNYFAVPPSIYRIKATLGILTLLRITVTGNPSSSGCCLAISLIQCGLQFSAPAAWAGVITSLSSALISARVMFSPPPLLSCPPPAPVVKYERKGVGSLPDFNDFLIFLDQNKIENILSDAQLKAKEVQFLDSANGIGNQIAVLSFTISLEVVGLYHAWLEQNQN